MKPSTSRIVWTLALVAIAAASPLGWNLLNRVLTTDAFAEYRRPQGMELYDIQLSNVHFKHFRGTRPVTSARADQIDVSRDRYRTVLLGVDQGTFKDDRRTFRYRAKRAEWNDGTQVLAITGGVRITAKDLDLRGPEAVFEAKPQVLRAVGGVTGEVLGGRFGCGRLSYGTESGVYQLINVGWSGRIPEKYAEDAPLQVRQREWNFRAVTSKNSKQNPRIWTHVDAIATDGEVIVIAPKIIHNQETDEFVATGTPDKQVQYFSAEANMVADQVDVFRKERRAVFGGKVVMLVKPKAQRDQKAKVEPLPAFQPKAPDQVKAERPTPGRAKPEVDQDEEIRNTKSVRDFPLVLNAGKIEYWYAKGSRRAVITDNPQGRQELPNGRWRHIWSHVGYYDGEKEELKLVSTKGKKDTRMKNSIGDDAIADWLVLSTAEDNEEFSGSGIEADFVDLSNEDPRNDDKKSGNPPGGNPPPGGNGGGQRPPPPRSPLRRV